jgi:hypothetical protein
VRVTALLTGCGFVFSHDADPARAAEWLTALRRNGTPAELPTGELFKPGEVARLLGISGAAVRAAVKRLKLPVGHGKSRTLPRASVVALLQNRARGCAPKTLNHYVRAVRGFLRWMVRTKRLGSNPLESLSLVNAAVEVRRARGS